MTADPFDLDQTDFSDVMRDIQKDPLFLEGDHLEPEHPLLRDQGVVAVCTHLQETKDQLLKARKPEGGMGDDAYFRFEEGLYLRPEVVVRVILDYVKTHPGILA